MALVNITSGFVIAKTVKQANSFWTRFKGLMFTDSISDGSALYLSPCRSIHTFFMRYPIDVVYLNSKHEVVAVEHALNPNKIGSVHNEVKAVVELPAGTIKKTKTLVGQIIKNQ